MKSVAAGVFLLVVFFVGVFGGFYISSIYRQRLLLMEAELLDHSLSLWHLAHAKDGMPSAYPLRLGELGQIPYPAEEWPARVLSLGKPVYVHQSIFRYETRRQEDGSMKYRLEVTLPDGYNFRSQGSTF